MKHPFRLRAVAFALAHLLVVLVLLHMGYEWGCFGGAGAALLHALLFPGEFVYFVLAPDQVVALLVAYPLNSVLWGWGLAQLWLRWQRTGGSRLSP